MSALIHHSTIVLPGNRGGRQFVLSTPFWKKVKHVKQSGGNVVIVVHLGIAVNEGGSFMIHCDEKSKPYADVVEKALHIIIDEYTEKEIGLNGITLMLTEGMVHPVDFVSFRVESYFVSFFRKMVKKNLVEG